MRMRSIALTTMLVAGLAGCSGGGDPDSAPVTGEWSLTLYPPGQLVTHQDAAAVQRVYLREEGGLVSGRAGDFVLRGRRENAELDLSVLTADTKGTMVEHSSMVLHLEEGNVLQGAGQTPHPQEATPGVSEDYAVRGSLVSSMTTEQVDRLMEQPPLSGGLSNALQELCTVFSAVESFVIGSLTDNLFRPMGGCVLAKSGGGYYVFGRDAPGSIVPVWTQNVYIPVEWSYCKARDYKFKFSYKSQALLTTGVEMLAHSKNGNNYLPGLNLLLSAGHSLVDLADQLDRLRQKYGNYALLAAVHPSSGFVGLYVIRERGNSDEMKKEAVIKTLAGKLGASVIVGHEVTDTFSLRRSIVPNLCRDRVAFAYLLGSANIDLN
jgi:hypothetical protein